MWGSSGMHARGCRWLSLRGWISPHTSGTRDRHIQLLTLLLTLELAGEGGKVDWMRRHPIATYNSLVDVGMLSIAPLYSTMAYGWMPNMNRGRSQDSDSGPAPGDPISEYPDFKYLITQLAVTAAAKIHYMSKLIIVISQYPNFSLWPQHPLFNG